MLTLSDIFALGYTDAQIYSDLHKDALGFRPRNVSFASVEDFQRRWNYLLNELSVSMEREANAEKQAIVNYDLRITGLMADHNIDYATAVRWDMQAEGVNLYDIQKVDYYFYDQGFGYTESNKRLNEFVGV